MTRDLRRYARQTNIRLIAGLLALLVVVGIGLIYIFMGPNSALLGLVCLGAALLPVGLIALILLIIDKVVKRARGDD